MKDFLAALQERVLFCDGAMGTMLLRRGVTTDLCVDELNLSNPDAVRRLHQDYLDAGADIIETNTFGTDRARVLLAGARIAREAAGENAYVAGALGPLGKSGGDTFSVFQERAGWLTQGGVDLFILETFYDLDELVAGVRGIREISAKPIVAQVTVQIDPQQLDQCGADVVGFNCGIGPEGMAEAVRRLAAVTTKPISVQPSAGLPDRSEGLCSPDRMRTYAREFVRAGARLIGACCGSTPAHIQAIRGGW
jgi:homocysteine S-methyltransferase